MFQPAPPNASYTPPPPAPRYFPASTPPSQSQQHDAWARERQYAGAGGYTAPEAYSEVSLGSIAPTRATPSQYRREVDTFMREGTWERRDAEAQEYAERTGARFGGTTYPGGGSSPVGPAVRHRVFVDARDRADPDSSPFDFSISLTARGLAPFRNVKSVELKGIAFPKVANEPYVIMDVEQLADQMDATFDAGHRSYVVLYFDTDQIPVGSIKPIKAYDFYQKDAAFNPALPTLDRLTIKFKKYDGSLITTADTAGATHVSFMLEVVTLPTVY